MLAEKKAIMQRSSIEHEQIIYVSSNCRPVSGVQCGFDSQSISCFIGRLELILGQTETF